MGQPLMGNRHGLVVGDRLRRGLGDGGERDEAAAMVAEVPGRHRITVGGDELFATAGFVARPRALNATAHVARNAAGRRPAVDGRTTRHPGYAPSRRARTRNEAAFAGTKEVAPLRRARHRGGERVGGRFTLAAAAYDLIRLPELLGAAA